MEDFVELRVSNTLKNIGITPGLLGYQYLRHAILISMKDETYPHTITKRLYPAVAHYFGTKSSRVERAMRHAIECAWLRGNDELINEIFRYTIDPTSGRPTNREFISTLVDYLKYN